MKKFFLAIILLTAVFNLRSQNYWSPSPHAMPWGVAYMVAVDKNVVWGIGGQDSWSSYRGFIRTTNGGATWSTGTVDVQDMYSIPGMISAADSLHAWILMYCKNGNTGDYKGIYATSDGGLTWARQNSAAFNSMKSFPDCVHFFNANEGWCMGDPGNYGADFEIYTTSDGGTAWQRVSSTNMADALPQETGLVGYCCSVGDTSWFGTSKGRIFRSADKGHNWTVSAISGWSLFPVNPTFRDHLNGLAQNMSADYHGNVVATTNGGVTWLSVTPGYSGAFFKGLTYVPGTPNTYIGTGDNGLLVKSKDGGHNWEPMQTPPEQPASYFSAWVDAETGWLSSFTYVYSFTGNLGPPNTNFTSADTSTITGKSVRFTNLSQNATRYEWTFPGGTPDTSSEVNLVVTYSGQGTFDVTLKATNDNSSSTLTRYNFIKVSMNGISDITKATISVSPNPAKDQFKINSSGMINKITLCDLSGREIFSHKTRQKDISVNHLTCKPGLYLLKMILEDGCYTVKIIIQ